MAKKMIRPLRSEADYDAALKQIERDFESEPKPGTPEADRFDLLALIVEDYERKRWPIEPPDMIDAIRYRMETGGLYPSRSWPPARLASARIRHPDQTACPHHGKGLEGASRLGHSGGSAARAAADARTKVGVGVFV